MNRCITLWCCALHFEIVLFYLCGKNIYSAGLVKQIKTDKKIQLKENLKKFKALQIWRVFCHWEYYWSRGDYQPSCITELHKFQEIELLVWASVTSPLDIGL